MKLKYSIVIPAYNEEDNIRSLVDQIIKLKENKKLNCEIIIVDDNSKDNTGKIADEFSKKFNFIRVIHRRKGNNGMGFALLEGTDMAKGSLVLWIMGDKSDDLDTIPGMIEKMREGYDMVLASRYMHGGSRGDLGIDKAILGKTYSFLCRLLFGIRVHDITNAFRCFRKIIIREINLESGDFAISPEFSIKAYLHGYRLGEVPTRYHNRVAGRTKFNLFRMGIKYLKLLKLQR